eukprot:6208618-Pleurochrysis_carterae.AAC.6
MLEGCFHLLGATTLTSLRHDHSGRNTTEMCPMMSAQAIFAGIEMLVEASIATVLHESLAEHVGRAVGEVRPSVECLLDGAPPRQSCSAGLPQRTQAAATRARVIRASLEPASSRTRRASRRVASRGRTSDKAAPLTGWTRVAPCQAGALSAQHERKIVAVDRRQASRGRAVVGGVDASEGAESCVPVPQGHQPSVLGASHVRWEPATRHERGAADAALPVVHLAALERVVVRPCRAVAVDGPAVVGREDEERLVPHALALERTRHVRHHVVGKRHHRMVHLPGVARVVSRRHEVEPVGVLLGHLERRVDDVWRPKEEKRMLGRVLLNRFEHTLFKERVFVTAPPPIALGTRLALVRLPNLARMAAPGRAHARVVRTVCRAFPHVHSLCQIPIALEGPRRPQVDDGLFASDIFAVLDGA